MNFPRASKNNMSLITRPTSPKLEDMLRLSEHSSADQEDLFHSSFRIDDDEILGTGTFAAVFNGLCVPTQQDCACKVVQTRGRSGEFLRNLQAEIDILSSIVHPHIIRLEHVHEGPDETFIVMEKVYGGDLLERINVRECYSECNALKVTRQVLQALDYLHSTKIVHRDVKPENILLLNQQSDTDVKLADFGFAAYCSSELTTLCGTPGYRAPEMLAGDVYGAEVDLWSVGVVLYTMIAGYTPFDGEDAGGAEQIRSGLYAFYEEDWDHISQETIELVQGLMTISQTQRLTAKQALEHVCFAEGEETEEKENEPQVYDCPTYAEESSSPPLVFEKPSSPQHHCRHATAEEPLTTTPPRRHRKSFGPNDNGRHRTM